MSGRALSKDVSQYILKEVLTKIDRAQIIAIDASRTLSKQLRQAKDNEKPLLKEHRDTYLEISELLNEASTNLVKVITE